MDMSKLPKFSQTPAPPPPEGTEPTQRVAAAPLPPAGFGAGDVWFSVIIGVVFLVMGHPFGEYTFAKLTHRPYHTGFVWPDSSPKAGQEVEYPDRDGNPMRTDSAMFLFGIALIVDAGVRVAVARRAPGSLALACLGFTLAAGVTAYNLFVAWWLHKGNVMPLLSLLAVAFGGYVAFAQWSLIQQLMKQHKS